MMLDATLAKGIVSKDSSVQRVAVWAQAGIALLVLLGAWRLHENILPYEYVHQNLVEERELDLNPRPPRLTSEPRPPDPWVRTRAARAACSAEASFGLRLARC